MFNRYTYCNKNGNDSQVVRRPAERERVRRRVGLSNAHISPRLEYTPEGSYLALRYRWKRGRVGGGLRGEVRGFSRQSRSRLYKFLARLRRDAERPVFITLTYPAEYPDCKRAKRDLDVFLKRLRRAYPNSGYLWRLEFQDRGAPHYHILVWGVRYIPWEWVARVWYEVVGSGDPRHLAAGVRVEQITSWRGVMSYVSKYLAKLPDTLPFDWTGRMWGYGGVLPLVSVVAVTLTRVMLVRLLRLVRRAWGERYCWSGWWRFSSDPGRWAAAITSQ